MPLYSPPLSINKSVSYLFIDGECLNQILAKVSARYFDGDNFPIAWGNVRGIHRKVFYFDAIPVQLPSEDSNAYNIRIEPKIAELANIEKQDSFHVRTGAVRHRRKRGNEQKMVDVQLAVDALSMASRGLFDSCGLLTGDLDFKPLVSALVEMGIDVQLIYPIGETNEELISASDRASSMSAHQCLLWISDDYAPKALLPKGIFNFKSNDFGPGDLVTKWDDILYGSCKILNNNGQLRLVTETSPGYPTSHRLELAVPERKYLKAYAEDVFDLVVPDFI